MIITFLGTRGNIDIRSKKHYRHTATLFQSKKTKILIDYGDDWARTIKEINPDAVFITHAHSDHAGGITNNFDYPVYATRETWQRIKKHCLFPVMIKPYIPYRIGSLSITAYPVAHSVNAPAVGYKISDHKCTVFYISDLIKIKRQKEALSGCDLYIGDGAIVERTLLVRKKNNIPVGHSPIIEQLKWCKKEKVPRFIVTHCGTEIVSSNDKEIKKRLAQLAQPFGVKIKLAHDGMKLRL